MRTFAPEGREFAPSLAQGLKMQEGVAPAARKLDETVSLLGVEPFHRPLGRQAARLRIQARQGYAESGGAVLVSPQARRIRRRSRLNERLGLAEGGLMRLMNIPHRSTLHKPLP